MAINWYELQTIDIIDDMGDYETTFIRSLQKKVLLFCFFVIFLKNVNVIVNKQLQCQPSYYDTLPVPRQIHLNMWNLILLHNEYLKFDCSAL